MQQATRFEGFHKEALQFLEGLSLHNNREWFNARKDDWQNHLRQPALAFIEALRLPLEALSPGIHVEPRVNGSLFRIQRDMRFVKDGRPYKEHVDFWFWHGERKTPVSALFMRLTATRLVLGAGCHAFTKPQLARFRALMADEAEADRLAVIAARLEHQGHLVEGASHIGQPQGPHTGSSARARFLRHSGLWAVHDELHPAVVGTADLVEHCLDHWQHMQPLHDWLIERIGD